MVLDWLNILCHVVCLSVFSADSPYPVKKHVAVIVFVLVVVIVVAAIIIITSSIGVDTVTVTVAIYRSSWINRAAMECIDGYRATCCHANPGDAQEWHRHCRTAASASSTSSSLAASEPDASVYRPKSHLINNIASIAEYPDAQTCPAESVRRATRPNPRNRNRMVERRCKAFVRWRNDIIEEIVELTRNIQESMQVSMPGLFWDVKALNYKLADRIEKLRLMDDCNIVVLDCGCRWVLKPTMSEPLIQMEQKDPKGKSAKEWAKCYLEGSAASAQAKMMNATSSSHANRKVDGDMERLPCRGCGGWISYPNFSCQTGSDPK